MNLLPFALRLHAAVMSRGRNVWFRALGVRLGGYVWMRRISIPRNWSDVTIEATASLDDGVVLLCSGPKRPEKILIRAGTYVNRMTMLDASERIEIGRNCLIGPLCYITDHDHGHAPGRDICEQPLVGDAVRIGSNVWVGAGVTILKGVTIGDGALIGAGAVVTHEVAAGEKVAGVPARTIGSREVCR